MRSPRSRFALLLGKEFRELMASRAFWLLLVIIGPLVGHGFITAVETYAEASGINSGAAALAQGLSPLDGILVPTFGAYDLAVTLLFPFVAIRLVSAEKSSGAWKLMLQSPAGSGSMLAAKGAALMAGWMVAWVPGLLALGLWKLYGGTLYAPETLNLLLGHLLHAGLAAGVAVAAAALADSAASAAIVTLGFTVGTWALEFVAAGRGGWLEKLASYTPTSALRVFEQGQFRLSTVAVTLLLALAGFTLAAVWLDLRRTPVERMVRTAAAGAVGAALVFGASTLRPTFDLSENRRNSFPKSDERALAAIRQPLHVTVYLAPEDPRLLDLNREVLSKLDRILPGMTVDYAARSRAGLFEGPADRYGEVWYQLGGRKAMSRSATEEIVLETIYRLAGVAPPAHAGEAEYPGHPLAARPAGAAWIFYALWPLVVAIAGWVHFRNRTRT
ncbi:MAG TPA: ABC transporter permease subunit [Bryobacteraceae bacterium]|nr:ABC transporter permease subunit [Bryobacteraceae bacterium]